VVQRYRGQHTQPRCDVDRAARPCGREGGEAYYASPGHTPLLFAGTELVEFTPTDELAAIMSVMAKNLKK